MMHKVYFALTGTTLALAINCLPAKADSVTSAFYLRTAGEPSCGNDYACHGDYVREVKVNYPNVGDFNIDNPAYKSIYRFTVGNKIYSARSDYTDLAYRTNRNRRSETRGKWLCGVINRPMERGTRTVWNVRAFAYQPGNIPIIVNNPALCVCMTGDKNVDRRNISPPLIRRIKPIQIR